eukprot:8352329-Alexandrium_andersonii.AAC.1
MADHVRTVNTIAQHMHSGSKDIGLLLVIEGIDEHDAFVTRITVLLCSANFRPPTHQLYVPAG